MKDEMELVQEMENVDDRNTDLYIDKLEMILNVKNEAVATLREELSRFQHQRQNIHGAGGTNYSDGHYHHK
jgi:hypothetical protein